MRFAEAGISELQKVVDTLLIIPNQNLFRVANEKTTFADAFAMADQVLYSGVACITDLMVKEGLINLDFADVRAVMREMGKAMMGTGEASGEKRALRAAEAAISNPLIDDVSMKGAKGLLISITGGRDLTLYEVDEAATRIREEVDSGRQHHRRRDLRREPRRHHPRLGRGDRRRSAAAARSATPQEARIAEATQRIRAEVPRADQEAASAAPTPVTAGAAHAAPQRTPSPARSRPGDRRGRGERSCRGRARRCSRSGRSRPKPSLFIDLRRRAGSSRRSRRPSFRRSRSGRRRAPRMPRIDELPMPAQNEMRARERAEAGGGSAEKPRMSLLQRLASVGLGRREDEDEPRSREAAAAPAVPMPERRPCSVCRAVRPGTGVGIRQTSMPQGLDPHGRQVPGTATG